jgi:hypothetical protein
MSQISRKSTIFIASAILLTNAACTTIKPVYDVGPASYASQVEVGDRVRLTYLDERTKEIRVTEVSETEIKGTIYKNTRREPRGYEIIADWRDVYSVEVVTVSALKTVGAGVGILVAIPLLAVGAVLVGAGAVAGG